MDLPFLFRGLTPEDISAIRPDLGECGHKLFVELLEMTSSEEDYEGTLKKCRARNQVYTDENFPPEQSSLLFPLGQPHERERAQKWKNYVWRRASEIFDPAYMRIISEDLSPNNMYQGTLRDCSFLSALSILAEKPGLIESLFLSLDCNEFGVYGVRIFQNGIEKKIILDDYLPCFPDGHLCFSSSKPNELWVMLLEKAWAKLNGSYSLTESTDFPLESVLENLTGAPCMVYNHDDDGLWMALIDAKEKGWIISGSAANTMASKELLEEMGLTGNLAYSILDVQEAEMHDNFEQIVKLRNPWGTNDWTSEWADSSNIWTEELKKSLNIDKEKIVGEKEFWMSYGDFCHYFSRVQICKYEK